MVDTPPSRASRVLQGSRKHRVIDSKMNGVSCVAIGSPPTFYFVDGDNYDKCRVYVANWTEVLMSGREVADTNWPTIPCNRGWEYNFTDIPYETIATEVHLQTNHAMDDKERRNLLRRMRLLQVLSSVEGSDIVGSETFINERLLELGSSLTPAVQAAARSGGLRGTPGTAGLCRTETTARTLWRTLRSAWRTLRARVNLLSTESQETTNYTIRNRDRPSWNKRTEEKKFIKTQRTVIKRQFRAPAASDKAILEIPMARPIFVILRKVHQALSIYSVNYVEVSCSSQTEFRKTHKSNKYEIL
ncbi:unnamed protein product, partial [Nesidiocoris tenuis]